MAISSNIYLIKLHPSTHISKKVLPPKEFFYYPRILIKILFLFSHTLHFNFLQQQVSYSQFYFSKNYHSIYLVHLTFLNFINSIPSSFVFCFKSIILTDFFKGISNSSLSEFFFSIVLGIFLSSFSNFYYSSYFYFLSNFSIILSPSGGS